MMVGIATTWCSAQVSVHRVVGHHAADRHPGRAGHRVWVPERNPERGGGGRQLKRRHDLAPLRQPRREAKHGGVPVGDGDIRLGHRCRAAQRFELLGRRLLEHPGNRVEGDGAGQGLRPAAAGLVGLCAKTMFCWTYSRPQSTRQRCNCASGIGQSWVPAELRHTAMQPTGAGARRSTPTGVAPPWPAPPK